MTRSIFDPTGDPERSGSRNLGPDAKQISHLPPEFLEEPDEEEKKEDKQVDLTEGKPPKTRKNSSQ